ncbi:MAG TPA: XRE family transcriptional regulator [Bacteriovoracaceae bacterium]|nr:XRE family transcriptional regulator [Bacteriovoracaceae bacterium]
MVNRLSTASKNIAQNLIHLRKRRGLSQMQLSSLSGVTRASIAQFESGSANPSLESLLKLSLALQISIDELISAPRATARLVLAGEVPLDKKSKNGVSLRKLLPDNLPATEMDELILQSGASMVGTPHIEGTREYFTCVKGEFKITVLGTSYKLKKGDVLSFPGEKAHAYRNLGKEAAQGISVVCFARGLE